MSDNSLPDPSEGSAVSTASIVSDARNELLIEQARRVRANIGSKRSDKLVRLFDFLLEKTIEGRAPTELEIANEAFSIGPVVDTPQDATVRVYVHRLRKSLEQAQADMPDPKLFIPKGEYTLLLTQEKEEVLPTADEEVVAVAPARHWLRHYRWFALAALVFALNVAAWWLLPSRLSDDRQTRIAETALWRPIALGDRPITLVVGDYYLFAESADPKGPAAGASRLVRDPSINAREDLDIYLMDKPGERIRIGDSDVHYVPSGVVMSLGNLFSTLRAVRGDSSRPVTLISVSQLTTDMLKSSDIVYIGQLSGLGTLLRNPLFQASGYKVGATYDELIDNASGQRYESDGGLVGSDERVARRDFGYLATLPGPSGTHMVIIAGMRDAGVRQMAETAENPLLLDEINPQISGDKDGFEALYQVRALGNLNISGQLLTARRLRSQGVWDRSTPSQRFPNDSYEGEGHVER